MTSHGVYRIRLSNLAVRVLVAAVGIPLILAVSLFGGMYFFLFVALTTALALREFYGLCEAKGAKPQRAIGITAGVVMNIAFFYPKLLSVVAAAAGWLGIPSPFPSQPQLFLILLIIISVIVLLVELFRNNGSPVLNIGSTLLGVVYIGVSLGTLIGLREIFVPHEFPVLRYFMSEANLMDPTVVDAVYRWGGYTVISIFACIWICDTAAYYVGLTMGKHKLFPRVSPNKSWEGAVAGFLAALLAAVAAKYVVLQFLSVGNAIVLGLIVGVFGQLGDLMESLFKRDAGVKDSSSLIPGHGGVLDRFDSLILVSPLAYLYLDYIVFS